MNKYAFLILLFFQSCNQKSVIPISNTLEIALGDDLGVYVNTLNKAWNNDTTAMYEFLKTDWVSDAAAYNHAFNVWELIESKKDSQVVMVLKRLNEKQLRDVRQLIEVVVDQSGDEVEEKLIKDYPMAVAQLKYNLHTNSTKFPQK